VSAGKSIFYPIGGPTQAEDTGQALIPGARSPKAGRKQTLGKSTLGFMFSSNMIRFLPSPVPKAALFTRQPGNAGKQLG
jgi:hypothetical protein